MATAEQDGTIDPRIQEQIKGWERYLQVGGTCREWQTTHENVSSYSSKKFFFSQGGLLKSSETDQPDLSHNRQCTTMRRRHLPPTKTQTSEHKKRPTSASNAVSTPDDLTDAECAENLVLSQLPASPRSQRPPGETGLQSPPQRRSNRNGDLPTVPCTWPASPVVHSGAPHRSLSRHLDMVPPVVVNANLKVTSIANCAPSCRGNPMASTSMALLFIALTEMFMSHTFTLARTVAPASRHTLARVLSVGIARLFTRPDRAQAALWRPTRSIAPHSHRASVVCDGRRSLSSNNVRKNPGCSWNSSWVGEPWTTSPLRGSQCERKTTGQAPLSPESFTRKPGCHSPGPCETGDGRSGSVSQTNPTGSNHEAITVQLLCFV